MVLWAVSGADTAPADARRSLFTNCPRLVAHSVFTDFDFRPLDFCHPPRRYSSHPCSTEGANRWRLLAEQGRRLRVRPSQPGLRGPRETPPGPTTWVRPATGWWRRMNAGESPPNQGRTVWAPLSVARRRSRGLRKTPQWGAERRAGPRYGPAIPSADGRGHAVRQANGCGVPRPRISALRFPLYWECEGFETDNLARQPAGMRRAATLPHGS